MLLLGRAARLTSSALSVVDQLFLQFVLRRREVFVQTGAQPWQIMPPGQELWLAGDRIEVELGQQPREVFVGAVPSIPFRLQQRQPLLYLGQARAAKAIARPAGLLQLFPHGSHVTFGLAELALQLGPPGLVFADHGA
jgi:hypothetical protein